VDDYGVEGGGKPERHGRTSFLGTDLAAALPPNCNGVAGQRQRKGNIKIADQDNPKSAFIFYRIFRIRFLKERQAGLLPVNRLPQAVSTNGR